jgi:hypothetical protein
MNCQTVQENLWEYQRHSLPTKQMLETSEHLKTCRRCSSAFEQLKQLGIELDHWEEIDPSCYFEQRLNAKLDELQQRRTWLSRVFSPLQDRYALTFVLLLISTVGLWVGFRHQQAQRLKSMGDVFKIQEQYLGNVTTKPSTPIAQAPANGSTPASEPLLEETIPETDLQVLENYDLLQDYDFLKSFDLADVQAETHTDR